MVDSKAPRKKLLVDWFRIIIDLERNGYRCEYIAAAVGAGKSTVRGWKQGSRPAYDEGDRMVMLWCIVMAKERIDVPMISPYDFRR
ncbi:MAG TPA: hypothetical protein VK165_10050 [Azonexus sp.]|nr:hypothetical protein [Azonexus sp.]